MAKKTQFRFPRRPLDGLILLDKPQGLSSNQALQKVRNLFQAEKAGHTGALDPLATGVLPICLGEATKVAGILLGNDKAYTVTARLGQTTDTDDAEGQLLRERPIPALTHEQLEHALQAFIGAIQQVPPIYSALKQGGEPMYLKARRGDVIDLPARPVHVHAIKLLSLGKEQFSLEVQCGSGTYIRSLIRDLGEVLGCGAHVTQLRRLWVEPFQGLPLWTLTQLQALAEQGQAHLDGALHPVAEALVAVPKCVLNAEQAQRVGMGQKITLPNRREPQDLVQLCDEKLQPLGLASINAEGQITVSRLFRWAAVYGRVQAPLTD
jgi:tRNA pseudouridine55 synthase